MAAIRAVWCVIVHRTNNSFPSHFVTETGLGTHFCVTQAPEFHYSPQTRLSVIANVEYLIREVHPGQYHLKQRLRHKLLQRRSHSVSSSILTLDVTSAIGTRRVTVEQN